MRLLSIMYFLWGLLAFVGSTSEGISVLDSFDTLTAIECDRNNITRYGKVMGEEQGCALMCLLTETCTSVTLTSHATESCNVNDVCVADTGAGTTYNRTKVTDDSAWVKLDYPAPGIERFNRQISGGSFDYGKMLNMPTSEDVCALHCLLIESCTAVTWTVDGRCMYKTKSAGPILYDYAQVELYTHVRTVIAGCIPGFSCYALLTYQNGQTKQTAREYCKNFEGYLVEFDADGERDAVMADERFNVVWGKLWVGIQFKDDYWQGETSDTPYQGLPWAMNHPGSPSEGQAAVIDPTDNWMFKSAPDNEAKTNTFCELPAITMTSRKMFSELNDGDTSTCFVPERSGQAAGTILKTLNLSPAPMKSFLVKVLGAGLVCDKNVRVWQELKKTTNKRGSVMSACKLSGSYIWHDKQLCLYMCQCDDEHDCSAAFARMDYAANISICELHVL